MISYIRIKKIFFSTIMLLLCAIFKIHAQSRELVEIYYNEDISKVDLNVGDNRAVVGRLKELFELFRTDSTYVFEGVEVDSYASPKGGQIYNEGLSARRSASMVQYLIDSIGVDSESITSKSSGIAWEKLLATVDTMEVPYKEEVLDILINVPTHTWTKVNKTDRWRTLVDSRYKRFMDLRGGIPYNYIMERVFSSLRYSSVCTIHYRRKFPKIELEEVHYEVPADLGVVAKDSVATEESDSLVRRPLFALKTNLLFDALTALNVELEVPIGKRWSVMGEWMFPWWLSKDNSRALEILNGSIEGRYWFSKMLDAPAMTGWFGGAYVSGGLYDLRNNGKGYQGEIYYAAGLSTGYAHKLNKKGSLRMEYSLGLGLLNTEYRYYEGKENNQILIWQNDGRLIWIGPTKAKISLVWMIHGKKKGGKL